MGSLSRSGDDHMLFISAPRRLAHHVLQKDATPGASRSLREDVEKTWHQLASGRVNRPISAPRTAAQHPPRRLRRSHQSTVFADRRFTIVTARRSELASHSHRRHRRREGCLIQIDRGEQQPSAPLFGGRSAEIQTKNPQHQQHRDDPATLAASGPVPVRLWGGWVQNESA